MSENDQPAIRILVWAQTDLGKKLPRAKDEIGFLRFLGESQPKTLVVKVVENSPWATLSTEIELFQPTIFHYIGHGKRGSLRCLETSDNDMGFDLVDVSPFQLSNTIGLPDSSVRGVFLNGCETARWAPHLIPIDGWMVGMNREVDDEVAGEFSAHFYTIIASGAASPKSAFDESLSQVQPLPHFTDGNIALWTEDLDPDDFLHKVFSRQAMRSPAIREGSLLELKDALRDVSTTLVNGRIATRHSTKIPGRIYCRKPLELDVVKSLKNRVREVEYHLGVMRRQYPEVVKYGDGWTLVPVHRRDDMLHYADRIDVSRNLLLTEVNRWLPPWQQLSMIQLSSTLMQ